MGLMQQFGNLLSQYVGAQPQQPPENAADHFNQVANGAPWAPVPKICYRRIRPARRPRVEGDHGKGRE